MLRTAKDRHRGEQFAGLKGVGPLTASFGVGTFKPSEAWSSLYKRVDARLYQAKRTWTQSNDCP
ncbi:GGDEF domain-containing protein [Mesorhizobium robiniae]|uniref:GGDEF domain-containing protein n=1 Tax=Mesorhizobium robiniae TaxID=559315 RepID=A0ABV2GLP3_9HYPH